MYLSYPIEHAEYTMLFVSKNSCPRVLTQTYFINTRATLVIVSTLVKLSGIFYYVSMNIMISNKI